MQPNNQSIERNVFLDSKTNKAVSQISIGKHYLVIWQDPQQANTIFQQICTPDLRGRRIIVDKFELQSGDKIFNVSGKVNIEGIAMEFKNLRLQLKEIPETKTVNQIDDID